MKRILFNDNFFSEDNEKSFYWAGMLAADGNLRDYITKVGTTKSGQPSFSHRKSISLSLIEKEMIESFLKDINCIGRKICKKYYTTLKGRNTLYSIQLYSFKMFDDLYRFGLTPRKSLTLEMPELIKNHPLVNHFIRGYFDGDGSIYFQRNYKYIEFRGTVSFLTAINNIVKSNINTPTKADVHIHSGCGSLKYCGNSLVPEVGEFLYKDASVWLDRKRQKFMAQDILLTQV